MVFILRFLICLITLGPRIVRIELVIWKKLNKMQFRYWGANNCGYKCRSYKQTICYMWNEVT